MNHTKKWLNFTQTWVYISKDETVYFENKNGTEVEIDVILSKGVEGMRYVKNK